MTVTMRRLGMALAGLLLIVGALRFLQVGVWPALHLLLGDFRAAFPTAAFAWLRPDFPTKQVWPGWAYGPMLHFLTLPLFILPRWWMVPPIWAMTNLLAIGASFVFAYRIAGVQQRVSWTPVVCLAAMWLWFKPLQICLADGNIELVEMAVTMAALDGLVRGRQRLPGTLLGIAAMIKFAPIGFLGWLGLRRQWRAVMSGLASIAVIAVLAQMALGWQNNGLALRPLWDRGVPQVNADTQSVTSMFLHHAGVVDYTDSYFPQRWFPTSRASAAAKAGELACVLFGAVYGILLFLRRRRPLSPVEIAALFLPMILLLTSNHQYYYAFVLVPVSVLFLRSVADRQWGVLTLVVVSYLLMSSPFRYTWIDQMGWFRTPFFYVINYGNVMAYGAFLLWATATYQMFSEAVVSRAEVRRDARALMIGVAVIVILFGGWMWSRWPKAALSPSQVAMQPGLLVSSPSTMALSPDGKRLAYVTDAHVLCVRDLDASSPSCWEQATDPSGLRVDPTGPFFSPDGQWLGFFSRGDLRKVSTAGGAIVGVNGAPIGQTASWPRDETILFATSDGIVQVPSVGGEATLLIPQRLEEGQYLSPVLNASGTVVVFTIAPAREEMGAQLLLHGGSRGAGTIVAQSLTTGRRSTLVSGSQPQLDEVHGRLLYSAGGQVLTVSFNSDALDVSDLSQPIVGDVLATADGGAQFAVSASGALVYVPRMSEPPIRRSLVWVDRAGQETPLPIPPNAFETPKISADGKLLAVAIRDVHTDVWVYDLGTGRPTRITSPAQRNETPIWLGKGSTVAYSLAGAPALLPAVLSSVAADGGRVPTTLWVSPSDDRQKVIRLGSASPDGRVVVGTVDGDLWVLDTSRDPRETIIHTPSLASAPIAMRNPSFSPDGHWIAYSSNQSGKSEIYVQPFPAMNDPHVVSDNGGMEPVWSRDGHELFYRGWQKPSGTLCVLAVPVSTAGRFTAGAPRALFNGSSTVSAGQSGTSYDVAADGQRFIMLREEAVSPARQLRVVRRWFETLPR